jgi:hypothetical protein
MIKSLPADLDSDSGSYTSGEGYMNWNWVSFLGNEHSRGWPTVFVYSLFSSNFERIFLQQTLSLISWITIAFAVRRISVKKEQFKFILVFIFVFSNLSLVQNFNNWIGRESITLSLALLFFANLLFYISNRQALSFSLALLFSAMVVINKPTLIFMVLFGWIFLLQKLLIFKGLIKKTVISLLFLFTVFYSLLNVHNQNIGWSYADPTGISLREINYSYLTSDFNPKNQELLSYFNDKNSPICWEKSRTSSLLNLGEPMAWAVELHNNCPSFTLWANSDFYYEYMLYLLTNPGYVVSVIFSQFSDVFDSADIGVFFGSIELFMFNIFHDFSVLEILAIVSIFPLVLLIFFSKIHRGFKSAQLQTVYLGLSLICGCFASTFFSLLIQPTHASDVFRQNYVSQVLVFFLFFLLLFIMIFTYKDFRDKECSS